MNKKWLFDLFQQHCIQNGEQIEISCFASSGGMYTSLNIGQKSIRSDDEYWNEIVALFEDTSAATNYPDDGIEWVIKDNLVVIRLVGFDDEDIIKMSIKEFSTSIYQLTD